jgi:hypothetical protein
MPKIYQNKTWEWTNSVVDMGYEWQSRLSHV